MTLPRSTWPDDHRPAGVLQRRRDEIRQRLGHEIRRRRRKHRRSLAEHLGELVAPCACSVQGNRRHEHEIAVRGGAETIPRLFERDHTRVGIDVGAESARRARDSGRRKPRIGRTVALRPGRAADVRPKIRKSAAYLVCAEKLDLEPAPQSLPADSVQAARVPWDRARYRSDRMA